MKTSTGFPYRTTTRLPQHDYSSSAIYYITICSYQQICIFGDVVENQVILSAIGRIVHEQWLNTTRLRPGVILDEYVIMPNHVHALLSLPESPVETSPSRRPARSNRSPRSLGSLVGGFKSVVTSEVRQFLHEPGYQVWQARFHDHVVRDERSLDRRRKYIHQNPFRWTFDRYNPAMGSEDVSQDLIQRRR